MRLGVSGLALKGMPPQRLIPCIRTVHASDKWFDRVSSAKALSKLMEHENATREASVILSLREIEIVRLVASGLRNQAIGKQLFISEGTVKIHLHNIYRKLNVNSRHSLLHFARNKRLL